MRIARCSDRGILRIAALLAGVAFALSPYQPTYGQGFTDNFNDGNDQGWTRYDVLRPIAPSIGGTFSFPGGNSYQIETLGNYSIPNIGGGRAGALVTGSNYPDFRISVDVIDWRNDREYVFGPIARTVQPGLGTTDGYLLILNTNDTDFELLRIEDEAPNSNELENIDIEMPADADFRIIFTGLGNQLTASVYDLANLNMPLGAFAVDAANYEPLPSPPPYTTGAVGLIVAQADSADDVPVGEGPPYAATFDNFRVTVPVAGEWNAPAGGMYSEMTNWVGNVAPAGTGQHARFLSSADIDAEVNLDQPQTLGRITFDNANRYKLSGSTLTLQNTGDERTRAEIVVLSGTHELASAVTLGSHVLIDASGTLVVSNAINWNGKSIDLVRGNLLITTASPSVAHPASQLNIGENATVELAGSAPALSDGTNHVSVANGTGSSLNISSGSQAVGNISGAGSTTVVGGATLTANHIRQGGGLNLNGAGSTATIRPNGGPAGTSVLGTLGIAGATNAWTAKFNVNNNDAVLQSSAANKAADFARLYNQVKQGFNAGDWAGNGITSATAAANTNTDTGLALVDNALLGLGNFSGQTVTADSILLKYTYYGDIDMNGQVDADDLTVFASNFGRTSGATQVDGDIDFNGAVNADDLTVFANNFNKGIGNPLATGSVAAVPEPTTIVLCITAAIALVVGAARRRRSGV